MIGIFNRNRDLLFYTWQYKDLKCVQTVEDGKKTLDFVYLYPQTPVYDDTTEMTGSYMDGGQTIETTVNPKVWSSSRPIEPEMRILYGEGDDKTFYVVKSVGGDKIAGFKVYAETDTEELQGYHFQELIFMNQNVYNAMSSVLTMYYNTIDPNNTLPHWSVITPQAEQLLGKTRTLTLASVTPADCVEKFCSAYLCEPIFDTVNRTVSFVTRVGTDRGTYFRKGLNLTSLDKKTDTMDLYTAIYPIGADGATLTPSAQYPNGYVVDFSYTDKLISYVWEDENYSDMTQMATDAAAMLADMCRPVVSYSCSVRDLASQYPGQYDYLSYRAGDTIQIVDSDSETYDKQRIVKVITYPLTPEKNSVEMSNTMLTFEQLQKKLKESSDAVQRTISSDGKISYRKIRGQQQQANALLSSAEQTLQLNSAGLTRSERVAQLNDTLQMSDTSGTEDEQITRAANALRLSSASSTGSAVLDDYDERIDEIEERLGEVPITLTPYEVVDRSIYNVITGETYGDNANYRHEKYTVTPGQTYKITGASASNASSYPAGAFFKNGTAYRLSKFGDAASTVYTDLEVTAPADADYMVLNKNVSGVVIRAVTTETIEAAIDSVAGAANSLNTLQTEMDGLTARIASGYMPRTVDAVIMAEKRNPFRFAAFDKGYVSFVFDDLRLQIDSIASIFEEFGMPVILAALPSRMGVEATGLTQPRGSFTPGMQMFDICRLVVENGGEIQAHNSTVITADNQYDYATMYDYFVTTKERLEHWGVPYVGQIRGLVRAGGEGQLLTSKEIERWVVGYYEYSNMGYTIQHDLSRVTINQPMTDIKTAIADAATNHTWLRIMGHDYDYGGGTTFTGENDLREILSYCNSVGVDVVTYAYMYDNFGSSVLEEKLKALINN